MQDGYRNELMAFLKLSNSRQQEILKEFNSSGSDSIEIFDVIPNNLDENIKLQDFAKFLILTKGRHERNSDMQQTFDFFK